MTSSQTSAVGILLAAGFGRRFDPLGLNNKLLQKLDNGVPVAAQSAQRFLNVVTDVVAVVQCPELAAMLASSGCHTVMFADTDPGMGASLACGVRYVVSHYPNTRSVLIGLADMPFVSTATIARVASELERGLDIVQPVYQQRAGHPVGFSSRHFPALMALRGDLGARQLTLEFPVLRIEVDDPGILLDVDLPSDLQSG